MTLPILLIFYVSKWKNNKKHWKIGIWRHCDVIIGRGKSKLGVGLLCTEMIIVCKFHDPSIIGSRDTEGGSEEPPPVTDWPKKPSLNRVKWTEKNLLGQSGFSVPISRDPRPWSDREPQLEISKIRSCVLLASNAITELKFSTECWTDYFYHSPQKICHLLLIASLYLLM